MFQITNRKNTVESLALLRLRSSWTFRNNVTKQNSYGAFYSSTQLNKKIVLWIGMGMLLISGTTAYMSMYIFNEHKCEITQKYVYMQLD